MLPSIALKRWNFPDNLDFKGKIVAEFSLSLNKQQINDGAIQKEFHQPNGIFHSIDLCHLLSFYSITSLVLFTNNNKLWNETKEDFVCIWLLQRITLYKRGRKSCF